MNDLVYFRSPLVGHGKKSFNDWCSKNNLDFDVEYKKLSAYFDTFPPKVHCSAQDMMTYKSWLEWYLASECHQRNIARGVM